MNPPTPPHAMAARPATVEQQLEHLTRVVTTYFEGSGEHAAAPPPTPPPDAWNRWGRWVTVVIATATLVIGALRVAGFVAVTPRDELTKLGNRITPIEASVDTLRGQVGDLRTDNAFLKKIACRSVRDLDLVRECAGEGLSVAPRR